MDDIVNWCRTKYRSCEYISKGLINLEDYLETCSGNKRALVPWYLMMMMMMMIVHLLKNGVGGRYSHNRVRFSPSSIKYWGGVMA